MNWLNRFNIFGIIAITSVAIAPSASAQFVIFVSGNDPATLQRVRAVSPSAFVTKINDQPIVQAGLFSSEASADQMAIALQQSGLSAQKYFRTSGGKESNVQVPFTDSVVVSNAVSQTSAFIPQAATPQQVVIQPLPVQPTAIAEQQQFFTAPQQTFTYSAPQQIVTNTVVPQVQTQQVLVPRWQQVLVPETRQVVTQTIVPQTQIVQTGFVQTSAQPMAVQTYVQPQTSFIPAAGATVISSAPSSAPVTYDGFGTVNQSFSGSGFSSGFSTVQSQPVATSFSGDPNFAQTSMQLGTQSGQTQTSRYVAVVPASASAANSQFLLSRVRQYIPTAFFSSSGRGSFINAGAYQNRDSAEAVSRYLRSQGVDSRVVYF